MSRRRRGSEEQGFSLIEVLIAITLFGLVAAGTTPLLVSAIGATTVTKMNTQAKNLLQQRIDAMRNLPYHVAESAGPYIDLLDTYFRDTSGSSNDRCDSHSYASATATYTCTLTDPDKVGQSGFTEQVDAQFLDQNRAVVVPISSYSSQSTAGLDVPPANSLGVTVTVRWVQGGATKSFASSTEISSTATGAPQLVGRVRNSAVTVETAIDDSTVPTTVHFAAGVVNGDVSLSTGATSHAVVQGALATYSTGAKTTGQASALLDAPPDQTSFPTTTGTGSAGTPCEEHVACFGPTQAADVTGTANSGLPTIASAAAPMRASVTGAADGGFWVSNTGTPLVRSAPGSPVGGYAASCTNPGAPVGNTDLATSAGYITTTGGASHSVTSCVAASARRIDIMPTDFAPDGVVQVTLDYGYLLCSATAASTGCDAGFRAHVAYWTTGGYQQLTVADGQPDPLGAGLLTKGPGGVQVSGDQEHPIWLGDYISSWSSGALSVSAGEGDLRVVSLSTVPTRAGDTAGTSKLNIVVGSLSATAQDNR